MSTKLTAYFSASGVTARAAQKLAQAAGAEFIDGGLLNGKITEERLKELAALGK